MSARTLDAAAIADRMNARPLDESIDGGVWLCAPFGPAPVFGLPTRCDDCDRDLSEVPCVFAAHLTLCLPCAVADCERAEREADEARAYAHHLPEGA